MTLQEKFEAYCRANGLSFTVSAEEIANNCNRFYRGDYVDQSGRCHRGDVSAWGVVSRRNNVPGIVVQCFPTGAEKVVIWTDGRFSLDPNEVARRSRHMEILERRSREEKVKRNAEAREYVSALWRNATPVHDAADFWYLKEKRVRPVGPMRIASDGAVDVLLLPFYAVDEKAGLLVLRHFQCISRPRFEGDSAKRWPRGSMRTGAFWCPDSLRHATKAPDRIGIAEGVATALSVMQVDGLPCVAAGDCGNLKAVAMSLRRVFPHVSLIIFADRDANGVGQRKAEEAASETGATVRLPDFTSDEVAQFEVANGKTPSDFNDLFILREEL